MRQRRTALKHVLSWERVQGSVGEPIHHSRSVRDQSRIGPHSPQSRLWSRLTAGIRDSPGISPQRPHKAALRVGMTAPPCPQTRAGGQVSSLRVAAVAHTTVRAFDPARARCLTFVELAWAFAVPAR